MSSKKRLQLWHLLSKKTDDQIFFLTQAHSGTSMMKLSPTCANGKNLDLKIQTLTKWQQLSHRYLLLLPAMKGH